MHIQSLRARRMLRSLPFPVEKFTAPTIALEEDSRVLTGLLNALGLAAAFWTAFGVVAYTIYSFSFRR